MLLTSVLVLLVYTSLVLPRNMIAINEQQPCEEHSSLLSSMNIRNNVANKNEKSIYRKRKSIQSDSLSQQNQPTSNATAALLDKQSARFIKVIEANNRKIMELERQLMLSQGKQKDYGVSRGANQRVVIDRADDGIRPLRVTLAHHPRSDLLGSFTLPSLYTLAITRRYGWEMEILPYNGSQGQKWLNWAFSEGSKMEGKGYGTGLQDANFRKDYNPAELNEQVYEYLGFFPQQSFPVANRSEWTEVKPLPAPGSESLRNACRKNPIEEGNGYVRCRLITPHSADTGMLLKHIMKYGTLEDYFTPELCKLMHDRFMEANAKRLSFFSTNSTDYNVAIHVRRGEINKKDFPDRWIDQSVYAEIARHICKRHPNANVHVFSSGKNEESWSVLEQVNDTCACVSFHLDVFEFDAWAHFIAADAFVTSRSTFSYVPALFAGGDVYAPEWGHEPLKIWNSFTTEGKLKLRSMK